MNINLTLFGQMIMFAMFVWFCMRFIWPPIVNAMTERQKRIESGLIAAERGFSEQKEAEQKAAKMLEQSKDQAAEIIANATKQSQNLVQIAKDDAKVAADKIKVAANAELEQDTIRVRGELKTELSGLVMQGVRAVLGKEVDAKTHQSMLDKLATST